MPIDPQDMIQAYERHRDELRGFFWAATRRKDGVDDLVQDVYVNLLRFPPREPVRDPAAYLFKVAWHLLQRFNKSARRENKTFDSVDPDRFGRGCADDAGAELAAEQQLLQLLRELPPLYGAVLILNRRDGMSYAQIAARLNISTSQVRRYLGLTLTHLKKAKWND